MRLQPPHWACGSECHWSAGCSPAAGSQSLPGITERQEGPTEFPQDSRHSILQAQEARIPAGTHAHTCKTLRHCVCLCVSHGRVWVMPAHTEYHPTNITCGGAPIVPGSGKHQSSATCGSTTVDSEPTVAEIRCYLPPYAHARPYIHTRLQSQ